MLDLTGELTVGVASIGLDLQLLKADAPRNKGSLRQIADAWGLPRWLVKKILSPSFPDSTPIVRAHLSDEHRALLTSYYEQGMTANQAWQDLVDNQGHLVTRPGRRWTV
ncbi:hypothetical protein [Streptomyces alboflavus]|uniref:hypothetical protein n=1 Tax=Streptomyces alboflavus TaxID=67267 RepID=UPI000F65867A|nr:hypothetical protein [Streptomyces alboflavus]